MGMSEQRYVPASNWRHDKAAIVSLTFDVDAESPLLAAGSMYQSHISTWSHQTYGPRVGLPRILRLLEKKKVPATFFFPGIMAEAWPEALAMVVRAGHEVGLHGYTHRPPVELSEASQREEIEKGMEALCAKGVIPVGYRAPLWENTEYTLSMLREFGMNYASDMFGDDVPYLLDTESGRVAVLPVSYIFSDWEQYVYMRDPYMGDTINRASVVEKLWIEELDASRATGSLCILTCHPFCSGRPSRLRAIADFIDFARECGDVGFARCDEIAKTLIETREQDVTTERVFEEPDVVRCWPRDGETQW